MPTNEEREAMTAARKLVLLGFIGARVGDPELPEALMYGREVYGGLDAVQVFGPDQAEAVRVVHGKLDREAFGTLPEVVDAISTWP